MAARGKFNSARVRVWPARLSARNDGGEETKVGSSFAVVFLIRRQAGQGHQCSGGDSRSWRTGAEP